MSTAAEPVRRTRKSEQRAATIEQILDAAEALFAEHGLYGVTLKDVARQVGVHHTLLNYYYADKKALFDAVFARRAVVTSERRMQALDAYEREAGDAPTVEGALHAFLDTDLDLYVQGDEGWLNYAKLGAQVANTPRWGAELMDEHFDPVVLRLIGLLRLGLSLRDRRADADAGAYRPDRQIVGRVEPFGRFWRHQTAHGQVHGRRFHRDLRGRQAGIGNFVTRLLLG